MAVSSPKRAKLDEVCLDSASSSKDEASNKLTALTDDCDKADTKASTIAKETDVGITEYISDHQGFSAVIKQRYADFLVNEISLENEIVHLTDTTLPSEETDEVKDEVVEKDDILLESGWSSRLKILSEKQEETTEKFDLRDCNAEDDKMKRSRIHKAIRNQYPTLSSETDLPYIIVVAGRKFKRDKPQKYWDRWPKDQGSYLHFVLYKENLDTSDAINLIAKYTRLKPQLFTFAGTKDRRGKTCQQICAQKVPAKKLHAVKDKLRNMSFGNYRYVKQPLRLGDLLGNHFKIVLRNVLNSDADNISKALRSLGECGFINYFGMQRFGTTSVPTHQVGRALINEEWYKAIELILKPRDGDFGALAAARKVWWESRDASSALKKLGNRTCIERHLLQGLVKCDKNDYVGALGRVPRNSRLMYLHSFQSYIWNRVISRRISEHGTAVLHGDLVANTPIWEKSEDRALPTVIPSDADISKYDIHDVLFPIPGHDIIYPDNCTKQYYTDVMNELQLQDSCWKCKTKDYSLPGAYRHALVKPRSLEWNQTQYSDVTVPLVQSDDDVMKGVNITHDGTGDKTALIVEFSLPQSCYATMALREMLKQDTSAAHQSTLNT